MLQQLDTAIAFVVLMLMLSLLVTAIVQALSALLDLRGKNLVRALADLFKQIDPELRKDFAETGTSKKIKGWLIHPFGRVTLATKLADAVSTHPVLAHTFTRAKAIRKDELIEVLKDLGSANAGGTIDETAKEKLQILLANQIPGGGKAADSAKVIADQLGTQFPAIKDDLAKAITGTVGKVSQLEAGVEKWFETVMDRASDIFTRWTRSITVLVSVLFVVVLHIDAGLILHQISTSAEIRTGLTKISDTAFERADESLKASDRATVALKEVAKKHKESAVATVLDAAPPLVSCAEGKKWLETQRPSDDGLQAEFAEECQKQTSAALRNSEDRISKIREELKSTELKIVPERIDDKPVFGDGKESFRQRFEHWRIAYGSGRHLLGTFAMIVLLSLGAPFWYNALKQLSNLKPAITQKVEKESSAST